MTDLHITPLDAGFGVRVRGSALAALPQHPEAVDTLKQLLAMHRVVVLADLHIEADELVALGGTLGRLRPARVRHASLRPPASEYVFVGERSASSNADAVPGPADAAHRWHMDYTFAMPIPRLSMLHVVRAPARGSRSGFADMCAVYRALPQHLKQSIDRLHARHYKHPHGVDVHPSRPDLVVPWSERELGIAHPLVLRDDNGTPSLCLPAHRDSPVVGMTEAQGSALLDELWGYVEPFGNGWEYEQASGELLVWDNRALFHRRSAWPADEARLTWFMTAN